MQDNQVDLTTSIQNLPLNANFEKLRVKLSTRRQSGDSWIWKVDKFYESIIFLTMVLIFPAVTLLLLVTFSFTELLLLTISVSMFLILYSVIGLFLSARVFLFPKGVIVDLRSGSISVASLSFLKNRIFWSASKDDIGSVDDDQNLRSHEEE